MGLDHATYKRLAGALVGLGVNLRQRASEDSLWEVMIYDGAAISGNIRNRMGGPRGLSVIVPDLWDAANIGFEVYNGANWVPLYDHAGVRITITGIAVAARQAYIAPAAAWALGCWLEFRLVSLNTATGANLAQGGDRVLYVGFLG